MNSRLLALETSGPVASVAVSVGGWVVARRLLHEQRRHAAHLLPAVEAVMSEARLGRGDLTGVVVGTGPGSFTGVRVAAAAGKGMAHALGIPLYGVSSLLAAALSDSVPREAWVGWPPGAGATAELELGMGRLRSPERHVLFDARGDRLFCGCFRLVRDSDPVEGEVSNQGPGSAPDEAPVVDRVQVVQPPSFRHLSEVLTDPSCAEVPHCGSGATRHAGALIEAGRVVVPPPMGVPSADGLLLYMASSSAPLPLESPFDWEPDYLRETGAVRGRHP